MTEYIPSINSDVLSNSLRAKTFSVQSYTQPSFTTGSKVTLEVPSLPQLLHGRSSNHTWTFAINYSATGLTGDAPRAYIYAAQNLPHSAIDRASCYASNGNSICNIQDYNVVYLIKLLLTGIDQVVNTLNLSNVNIQGWLPYSNANSSSGRVQPYVVAGYEGPAGGQLVNGSNQTINITVNTSFSLLPIFGSDGLFDLAALASQTRTAMKYDFQVSHFSNWMISSASGGAAVTINSVNVFPNFTMCNIQPSAELSSVVGTLINSNNFLVPITSYYVTSANHLEDTRSLGINVYIDEESVSSVYVCHRLVSPNMTAFYDALNCFTSGDMVSMQIRMGGTLYPQTPITRDNASFTANSGLLYPVNKFDAIQFMRNLQNCKQDVDDQRGIIINPQFYNSVNSQPNPTNASTTVTNIVSCDFIAAYSFDRGVASSAFGGLNTRQNGAMVTVNLIYDDTSPSSNVYVVCEYQRMYILNSGSLIYITQEQSQAAIQKMSPQTVDLLNKLLNISTA